MQDLEHAETPYVVKLHRCVCVCVCVGKGVMETTAVVLQILLYIGSCQGSSVWVSVTVGIGHNEHRTGK